MLRAGINVCKVQLPEVHDPHFQPLLEPICRAQAGLSFLSVESCLFLISGQFRPSG
jgi:hypothetical protein